MLHHFSTPIHHIALPQRFTYPFCYTPHPLCLLAAEEVQHFLKSQSSWVQELEKGKMFGVLVVQTQEGEIGYLAAFSGILAGTNHHPFFVPPIYDLLHPKGFFKQEEENISTINQRIQELEENQEQLSLTTQLTALQQSAKNTLNESKMQIKLAKQKRDEQRSTASPNEKAAMIRESQFQKAEYKRLELSLQKESSSLMKRVEIHQNGIQALKEERKIRSAALQHRLFEQFKILNARGEKKTLCDIFEQTIQKVPPAGAGECAAPKLLQQAYLQRLKPLAMAEFWWGQSSKTEVRHHGHYYPACKGKCHPILQHTLQGLDVDTNPLIEKMQGAAQKPEVVYEDKWLVVVNKPAGMLSVPGKEDALSVYSMLRLHCPEADGPMIVHRLDMATSGLMVLAKTKQAYHHLQAQFSNHTVKKRYLALLEGLIAQEEGTIELPLCPDLLDRPRQIVNITGGKPAITHYQVLKRMDNRTCIAFYPYTGRTHQLRVHAAHPLGLNCPIVGDGLYGTVANRLCLHAQSLEFRHPTTGEIVSLKIDIDFF